MYYHQAPDLRDSIRVPPCELTSNGWRPSARPRRPTATITYSDPARWPAIEAYFAEHELTHYSILRTSVVPTIIQGGFRSKVIPSGQQHERHRVCEKDDDRQSHPAQESQDRVPDTAAVLLNRTIRPDEWVNPPRRFRSDALPRPAKRAHKGRDSLHQAALIHRLGQRNRENRSVRAWVARQQIRKSFAGWRAPCHGT